MVEGSVADGAQGEAANLQIDPFSFFPGVASKIVGLGGSAPGHDPYYVFHTPYVRAARGVATFTVRLSGLTAKRGTLTLRLHMLPMEQGAAARLINTERTALNRLIAIGGEVSMRFEAFPGMTYAVYGLILDDTDAEATSLSVTLDRPDDGSETSAVVIDARTTAFGTDKFKPIPRLLSLDSASLAHPVAQMCTAGQFRERVYGEWVARLGEAAEVDRRQWELVYILQVLRYYGMLEEGAQGIGFAAGADPLPAAMAAMGARLVATGPETLGLDDLRRPAICDEASFADRVAFRAIDPAAVPEDLVNFDFGWSIGAGARLKSAGAALKFVEAWMGCLRPGGLAVHVFDFSPTIDALQPEGRAVLFRRLEMERLALTMISRGHEVAQIKLGGGDAVFDRDVAASTGVTISSFGFIVRKAAAPF